MAHVVAVSGVAVWRVALAGPVAGGGLLGFVVGGPGAVVSGYLPRGVATGGPAGAEWQAGRARLSREQPGLVRGSHDVDHEVLHCGVVCVLDSPHDHFV